MKKRITFFCIICINCFSTFAVSQIESYNISSPVIITPDTKNNILVNESFLIKDFTISNNYTIKNIGNSCKLVCEINVTETPTEEYFNKKVIPEDFKIIIDGKEIEFIFKNNEKTIPYSELFKDGIFERGTNGKIIFDFEIGSNEEKHVTIYYSNYGLITGNASRVLTLNYMEGITHSEHYKSAIILQNLNVEYCLKEIIADTQKTIFSIYNNYYDSDAMDIHRKQNDIYLSPKLCCKSISLRFGIFMDLCYSSYFNEENCLLYDWYDPIYLNKEELNKYSIFLLNINQLKLLRNAFYAVHGYKFKNQEITDFFMNKLYGYSELQNRGFKESYLSSIELHNIEMIKMLENNTNDLNLKNYKNE